LGTWMPIAAAFALAYLALSHRSPWARFLAPAAVIVVAVVLLTVATIGYLRGRKGTPYFAKWIDLASDLEDRLASAVEWAQLPNPDRFQHRCIEQLTLQLKAQHWKIVLPVTRPRRFTLMCISTFILVTVTVIYLHQEAPLVEVDAQQYVTLSK